MASGRRDGHVKHLAVFCGRQPFRPFRISGFDEVILDFKSDWAFQGKGFVLEYQQV